MLHNVVCVLSDAKLDYTRASFTRNIEIQKKENSHTFNFYVNGKVYQQGWMGTSLVVDNAYHEAFSTDMSLIKEIAAEWKASLTSKQKTKMTTKIDNSTMCHESWLDVCEGSCVYELVVGYNIQNALYWNPEDFGCNIRRITAVNEVQGMPKRREFTLEEFSLERLNGMLERPMKWSHTISSQLITSCTEVRIFDRIYFGSVLESKIFYVDNHKFSRFYICDRDFLEEVLRNMREDFIRAQKLQMRKMKQNIKQFNCDFRDAMKLL